GFSVSRDMTLRPLKLPTPGPLEEPPEPVAIVLKADQGLELLHELQSHTEYIWASACSADGKFAITGGAGTSDMGRLIQGSDFDLRLWNLETGRETGRLSGHTNNVMSLALSPDSQRAASGSQEGTLILWDVSTRKADKTIPAHRGDINALTFSP